MRNHVAIRKILFNRLLLASMNVMYPWKSVIRLGRTDAVARMVKAGLSHRTVEWEAVVSFLMQCASSIVIVSN
jgi:hypothetical protein